MTWKSIPYWTRNSLLDNPDVNITFDQLLSFNKDELKRYFLKLRRMIKQEWDDNFAPPKAGKTKEQMESDFCKMQKMNVHHFLHVDELSLERNVIVDNSKLGSAVDQFFSHMMKVRIDYSANNSGGTSIYDIFDLPEKQDTFLKGEYRHLRKDSFYNYSQTISKGDIPARNAKTGYEWLIDVYYKNIDAFSEYDFWLNEIPLTRKDKNTGYVQQDLSKIFYLTAQEVQLLIDSKKLNHKNLSNIDSQKLKSDCQYQIRLYHKQTKLFPKGFMGFRIGYVQSAVNFPPMIAKYLYEKYTDHIDVSKQDYKLYIYDPSAGWGGRLAGALSMNDRQGELHVHYVGTDPNTDNIMENGVTRYEVLGNFIQDSHPKSLWPHKHSFSVYTYGSEYIGEDKKFASHLIRHGGFDLVFTSPPYFNRERYNETDGKQSFVKYPVYEDWRDNFLKPTLTTAFNMLKKDRYLLWNIADIKVGEKLYYPLEEDSKKILLDLGMEFKGYLKMALMNMPGANRVDEKTGVPTCKNFVKIDGKYRKVEPIMVFWKPGDNDNEISS